MSSAIHVSIKPDILFDVLGFPITNTLLTTWIVIALLCLGAFCISRNLKEVPGRMQAAVELAVEGLLSFLTMIAGSRRTAEKYFPILGTVFFLVLFSNWMGIFPGVGSIGFWEEVHHEEVEVNAESHDEIAADKAINPYAQVGVGVLEEIIHGEDGDTATDGEAGDHGEEVLHSNEDGDHAQQMLVPLFRSANSDLNITLALALLVVTLAHVIGISALGLKGHTSKFFTFSSPINFFVGILEFIGEFSRIISFSFRLFGNIFAGEVLLVIISFLVPYVVPIPFLGLEIFVGIVQATIFAVLGTIFFVAAETAHGDHGDHDDRHDTEQGGHTAHAAAH